MVFNKTKKKIIGCLNKYFCFCCDTNAYIYDPDNVIIHMYEYPDFTSGTRSLSRVPYSSGIIPPVQKKSRRTRTRAETIYERPISIRVDSGR